METVNADKGLYDDGVIEQIHPQDEMFHFIKGNGWEDELCISHYMTSGYSAWKNLRNALKQFGRSPEQLESVLDFASGYGRNTRFMIQDIPPEKVKISDVTPEMISFQTKTFGVRGVVSCEDPEQFQLGEQFEVIICISLFSHLGKDLFDQWLDRLLKLLKPGGLLLFTTRPMDHVAGKPDSALVSHADENPEDYAFQACSETGRISKQVYGTSWVSPDFVRRRVDTVDSERKIIGFGKNYIWCDQDLYIIGDKSTPYQDLSFENFAHGYLGLCYVEKGKLFFQGWSFFGSDRKPGEGIRVLCGGRVLKVINGQTTLASPGVAEFHSDPRLSHCGFCGQFDFEELNENKDFIVEVECENIFNRMYYKFGSTIN